jgi:serine/threonine-protein kinase
MAVVYKAWQRSLERLVALKVLPDYFQHDPEFLTRFHREAKAAAKLNHANIVTIYDVGAQAGVHYIAMEYLEGGSLRNRLADGPLDLREAQRILAQIASALDYAHGHGLIHRDIKPANVLFTADGRAKVADFGIARASDVTQLTRTGVLMGTPEYMAPEQAAGGAVDHRTDLYALGVVLYQMLTGYVPFRGTTPHAILHAVIYEAPRPPRQLNPNLSPALESVVLKAVAKQPEQRFQQGGELAAALRAVLAGKAQAQIAAVPPHPRAAPSRRLSSLVWLLAGLAAVLVVVLGAITLLYVGGRDGGTPTGEATRVVVVVTSPTDTADTVPTALPKTMSPPAATMQPPPTELPVVPTDTAEPPADTRSPPPDTPLPPTSTPIPPTDTPPPTPTVPPSATPTTPPSCGIQPQGLFAGLWQVHQSLLGCPVYAQPRAIQDAEQAFQNGHMFWRADNDFAYVVYEQGSLAGTYQMFTDMWNEGDPDYSCPASAPAGLVQPKRGFGAVWCHLGGPNAAIGWGLGEEAGKGPGNGDPLVQDFEQGMIFRDSDGTSKALAYVLASDGTFARTAY